MKGAGRNMIGLGPDLSGSPRTKLIVFAFAIVMILITAATITYKTLVYQSELSLLTPAQLSERNLALVVEISSPWQALYNTETPEQVWEHSVKGFKLYIHYGLFGSPAQAQAICVEEARSTAAISREGSYSGTAIGDHCWCWPSGARLLARKGSFVVSVFVPAIPSAYVRDLIEDVAVMAVNANDR